MPETTTSTDSEQSLENSQESAEQHSSDVPGVLALGEDEASLPPNYNYAFEQLDWVEESQRHRIAVQMGSLVDLGAQYEQDASETKPEDQRSELYKDCIERIGRHFYMAYDSGKTEDEVWEEAIKQATEGKYGLSPFESRGAALAMSKISGIELTDEQMVKCLKGSRRYAGIAAWSEQDDQYEPISIDEAQFAQNLIDTGKTELLLEYLYGFRSLPADIAYNLVEAYPDRIVACRSSFVDLDSNLLAHMLLDKDLATTLVSHIEEFENLDDDILDALITSGDISSICAVASSPDRFENPDYQKIADKLTEGNINEQIRFLAEHIDKFRNLNNETAMVLLRHYPYEAISDWGVFKDLTVEQIADALVENRARVVLNCLYYFSVDERGYLAKRVMDSGPANAAIIFPYLQALEDSNFDADALTEMFMNKDTRILLRNFENLINPDVGRIVDAAIEQGGISTVLRHIGSLKGLRTDVAQIMIDKAQHLKSSISIAEYADSFSSPAEALKLIPESEWLDSKFADTLVDNIARYNLPPDILNDFLTRCAQNYTIGKKIKQLDLVGLGLEQEAIDKLLSHIATLKPQATGIEEENPFGAESGSIDIITLTKPGTDLHALGSKVSRLLREAIDDPEHPFYHLAHLVDAHYEMLTRESHEKPEIGDVLGEEPGSPTNSMYATYRRLAADYLAMEYLTDEELESTLEDVSKTDWTGLDMRFASALKEANKKFLDVLVTDVPYYDKLFTEWDAKRLGQKEFQEVFLGRDGIYAYIARRAQIQARKRFLGIEGEDHDLSMPTYLVYPRVFRDNLTVETKEVYLRQNIPNQQAAHYYDTGFTGSMPQDIMKVLGLSEDEWDERIRLLSGSKRDRTVLGLNGDKRERDEIVNAIEYNVKNEDTAAGLYSDEHGNLQPFAEPTSPKERLQFAFVQQALHRYYYIKEMDALRASETRIAMTSTSLAGGELRLSNGLDDAQKQELAEFFDHDNIGLKLLRSAKQIKISDPTDPYPDQAVFEIPLTGTDGVIVKSVVTDKQQGPLDEFEALILLQKVGVDSPKPLGRIFTNDQHGFVVMEKLPGISGRAIKQYFDDNDISTADQLSIFANTKQKMTEIAETIRRDTGLDKPWRLKDFMIVFEGTPTTVGRMLPIDFERANVFDPQNPRSIEV